MLPILLLLAGCGTPIGARRVSPRTSYNDVSKTALNSDDCSSETREVLHRFGLTEMFEEAPDTALAALHARACTDNRRDLLYALAELNYLHGERLRDSHSKRKKAAARDAFLASAIYAYFYLAEDSPDPPPPAHDRRFRYACDFYNRGLGLGLLGPYPTESIGFTNELRHSAAGPVPIELAPTDFSPKLTNYTALLPADEYEIHGLNIRNRQSGIGAPLIASTKVRPDTGFPQYHPASAFLRLSGGLRAWNAGELKASLELYSADTTRHFEFSGRQIPLQLDYTAPLAYALRNPAVWKLDKRQFFSSEQRVKTGIYSLDPFVRGKVPVVLVHGTMSSPIWWAEMINTLSADRVLNERCQFWCFIYNTGNPVSFSAGNLRAALEARLKLLDPEGQDTALRQVVVIGHSQGGLLTKLTATDTGDALWKSVSDKPLASLDVSPETRALLQTHFFFTALPEVKSVVFICTPHRGSYLATRFVRRISRWFMNLPKFVAENSPDFLKLKKELRLPKEVRSTVPSSLDSMSPKSPWLLALAALPVAPGVEAHSIIAIKNDDQPPEGTDGVVKYTSAHVDYAESEFIVRSGHSCQDKPETIEEVRRILLEHLAGIPSGSAP